MRNLGRFLVGQAQRIQSPSARRANGQLLLLHCLSLGVVALAIRNFLTESILWGGLWPADIQERIVSLWGGSTRSSATGVPLQNLAYLAVLLRVGLAAGVVRGVSSLLQRRQLRRCQQVEYRPNAAPRSVLQFPILLAGAASLTWLCLWFVGSTFPESAAFLWLVRSGPSALALICGLLLFAIQQSLFTGVRVTKADSPKRWRPVFVGMAAVGWVAVSFWMNERLYAGLWIPHGDSAMYEEHLWNLWHGKGFRSYLDQGLFLGEHIQFIHVFLLPLHLLWPSHLLLELAESIALGVCVVPIYRMTQRATGCTGCAVCLSLIWLCYVPMHFLDIAIDFKTLRPICYGLPFLCFGLDFADQRRPGLAAACFAIALTAKEDFALIVAPIGLSLTFEHLRSGVPGDRRRARWALGLSVLTAAYLLLAVLVLIPWFRDGQPVHYSRYFGDLGSSPAELVRSTLTQPWKVMQRILSFRTLTYLIVLLLPLGGLPLLKMSRLAAGIPSFLMLSLLQLSSPSSGDGVAAAEAFPPVPYHHFHAPLLPVLFWAAAGGLGWLVQRRKENSGSVAPRPRAIARFALCVTLFVAVFSSMMPLGAGFWSQISPFGYQARFVPRERARQFLEIRDLLPQDARIASTDYVHTRLTHCERSYDYSDYLRAVNDYQPGVPPDTEYIVIDTRHPYSRIRTPEQVPELQLADDWELVPNSSDGYFIILRRREEGSPPSTDLPTAGASNER